jgi:hypothetical protein
MARTSCKSEVLLHICTHTDLKPDRLVHVFDPTDTERYQIPIGKQTLTRGGMIWYTPCTGIWQTVWLESAPIQHVAKLDLAAGADGQGT